MPNEHYNSAVRQGERAVHDALARGESPTLPVLEDILKTAPHTTEMRIGTYEIPIERIIGTYTGARSTSFGPNFMPLTQAGDEFASKWSLLCEAHLSDGITDPIKVYEYMNFFYVIEGNKRVSVFKYFGAATVYGEIIRLLPPKSDDPKVRAYYAYLDFFKLCPVLSPVFTDGYGYWWLQIAAGKKPHEVWTQDEVIDFKSLIARFDDAFETVYGEKPADLTSSDAFLGFLHYHKYRHALYYTTREIVDRLEKLKDDLRIRVTEEVSVVMNADDGEQKSFLGRLFDPGDKKLRVAFLYSAPVTTSGWLFGHELGRNHLIEKCSASIETAAYVTSAGFEKAEDTLLSAINDGSDIIFATSPLFADVCVKVAASHPQVKILVCGINLPHALIRTYYSRFYEAKYLSGIIAGILSEKPEIGYLTDYPIHANIAALNAFALGVQSVRPDARIHVQWATVKDADPDQYFAEHGIEIISGRDLSAPLGNHNQGLYRIVDGEKENLAMAIIDWGVMYEKIIESIRNGRWDNIEKNAHGKALSYWFGFSDDVVDLFMAKRIPERTKHLIMFLRSCLQDGSLRVFRGIIRSNRGENITEHPDDSLSVSEIITMDWLNENIVGSFPNLNELKPQARTLVLMQGLPGEPPVHDRTKTSEEAE